LWLIAADWLALKVREPFWLACFSGGESLVGELVFLANTLLLQGYPPLTASFFRDGRAVKRDGLFFGQ